MVLATVASGAAQLGATLREERAYRAPEDRNVATTEPDFACNVVS